MKVYNLEHFCHLLLSNFSWVLVCQIEFLTWLQICWSQQNFIENFSRLKYRLSSSFRSHIISQNFRAWKYAWKNYKLWLFYGQVFGPAMEWFPSYEETIPSSAKIQVNGFRVWVALLQNKNLQPKNTSFPYALFDWIFSCSHLNDFGKLSGTPILNWCLSALGRFWFELWRWPRSSQNFDEHLG